MRKYFTHKPFLVFLITTFILLQWSGTHIHLAGEHEHDGDQHQHAVNAHQHQSSSHHADAIDLASDLLSHVDNNKVIELDHDCVQFHGKFSDHYAALASTTWDSFIRRDAAIRSAITYQEYTYQTYYQYTALRLRAPPRIT